MYSVFRDGQWHYRMKYAFAALEALTRVHEIKY